MYMKEKCFYTVRKKPHLCFKIAEEMKNSIMNALLTSLM